MTKEQITSLIDDSMAVRLKDELPVHFIESNTEKPPYKVDVAVLLLFFTRTKHTVITFNQIRKARPSKLFLYQDGPRQGRVDDEKNITECRDAIEAMIDWNCEIHRLYQTKNYGCDPSEFLSQKWMFSYVDKGIIIEDDDVMSESFFPFCKELLDKYENDTRINMICGQNHLGTYDANGADYIFCCGGSIWGWATWKRTIDSWDPQYKFIDDPYAMKCLEKQRGKRAWNSFIKTCKWHKGTGKEYYESIRNANQFVNNQLNIVPTKNMCCNIGIGSETTHSVSTITYMSRALRPMLFSKTYEMDSPLKHPNYVIADELYQERYKVKTGGGLLNRILKFRRIESILYRVFPILGRIGASSDLMRVQKIMSSADEILLNK